MRAIRDENATVEARRRKVVTPWLFYRGVAVVTHEAAARLLKPNVDTSHGAAFIPHGLAKRMGLVCEPIAAG